MPKEEEEMHENYRNFFESENGYVSKLPKVVQDGLFERTPDTKLEGLLKIQGYDFNKGVDYEQILKTYIHSGCQAAYVGQAINILNKMIDWRLSHEEIKEDEDEMYKDPEVREDTRCTLFLGYSSSMISSGMRDIIRYLVQHKMVDAVVATAGGIEEDICKVYSDFYQGDFGYDGKKLREEYTYRVGNIFIPSSNYDGFEYLLVKIINEMHDEQDKNGTIFSPSDVIARLGKYVDSEESVYYW